MTQTSIVVNDQLTSTQRPPYDPGRIEGVRAFTDVLKQQHVRPIVDAWDGITETKWQRTKAIVAACVTLWFHVCQCQLG